MLKLAALLPAVPSLARTPGAAYQTAAGNLHFFAGTGELMEKLTAQLPAPPSLADAADFLTEGDSLSGEFCKVLAAHAGLGSPALTAWGCRPPHPRRLSGEVVLKQWGGTIIRL